MKLTLLAVFLSLIALVELSPAGLKQKDKLLSDTGNFNDITDPGELIKRTVDTEGYKKALENAKNKVKLESRSTFVNDDDDFDAEAASAKTSGKILMTHSAKEKSKTQEKTAEYGEFFQGDMMMTKEQQHHIVGKDGVSLPSRTGILDERYRWPKIKGVVYIPFMFYDDSRYSYQNKLDIIDQMELIEKYTCIYFTPRQKQKDFIVIYSGSGCSSHVGKIGGQQNVSLKKNGCLSAGTILHELIHAIGYDHMQNHAERNNYIQIMWDNIPDKVANNFVRVDSDLFDNFNTPYDYYSVMHYDSFAFTKNRKRTLVTFDDDYRDVIGQREGLSLGDIKRIKNMYDC